MNVEKFQESMYELIVETSTQLPKDVRRAIKVAKEKESLGTRSAMALADYKHIKMADDNVSPICQDNGLPTFKIKTPVGVNQIEIKKAIYQAIAEATKNGKLRPNSVDSLNGKNSQQQICVVVHRVSNLINGKKLYRCSFILKGGGCEIKTSQYSLPYPTRRSGTSRT